MVIYALPQDTLAAFLAGKSECLNMGLLFDRYTAFGDDWTLEGTNKFIALKGIVEAGERARRDKAYTQLMQQYYRRWREAAKAAGVPDDCFFEASPEWRLVIGLGRESVLETGFTFHRLYGFPYLPGSSLKGLTQAWALWQIAERLGVPAVLAGQNGPEKSPMQQIEALMIDLDANERQKRLTHLREDDAVPATAPLRAAAESPLLEELEAYSSKYRRVFGTADGRGQVIFFDAVPVQPPLLKVDVMNPHYGPYYRGDSPPADYLSPVPVYFLTVDAGSRFAFAVAARPARPSEEETQHAAVVLARQARDWLQAALANLGAGGKTSAGYGYWTEFHALR